MGVKISITGHTTGLGAELFKFFSTQYETKGFSRSTGFDIKSPLDRKKILRESNECNVFINLVHNYYHQTDLLYEFFKAWENEQKLIINISSAVINHDNWGTDRLDYLEYKNQKIALETMSKLLLKRDPKVKIQNYRISEINFSEDTKNLNNIINEFQLHQK